MTENQSAFVGAHELPSNFLWGAATAAYQVEGAVAEDGRGPSIWDTFSHEPGRIVGNDNGDMASHHYRRWREDVEHIVRLGLDAYRFSISWSRVQPDGTGSYNRKGIEFYRHLLDELVVAGVRPIVTLYHWDLPAALQEDGGWTNRVTAFHFAAYARKMAEEFGSRVSVWLTLNEPWCAAYLGYAAGVHPPGVSDDAQALCAAHHLNLAHGLATTEIRRVLGPRADVSVALNVHVVYPNDPLSAADRIAAQKIDLVANQVFLGPMLEGGYPAQLLENTHHISDWSFVRDGDLALINQPLTWLGVNYYFSNRVCAYDGSHDRALADGHHSVGASPWVGCEDVEFVPTPGPHTAMGWNIDPGALSELLVDLSGRYPHLPLLITENGAAFDDEPSVDSSVHDGQRIDYLSQHIRAGMDAVARGAHLRGFMVWSLLDNFEWVFGYSKRFGLIYVDYATGARLWKDSAHWYQAFIANQKELHASADGDAGDQLGHHFMS